MILRAGASPRALVTDHALHAATWAAVRWCPWSVALEVGRFFRQCAPAFRSTDEARASWARLRGGTCLSRAMVTSARLHGSAIRVGVRREGGKVLAHAWVEVKGQPLVDDVKGEPFASVDLARSSGYR